MDMWSAGCVLGKFENDDSYKFSTNVNGTIYKLNGKLNYCNIKHYFRHVVKLNYSIKS